MLGVCSLSPFVARCVVIVVLTVGSVIVGVVPRVSVAFAVDFIA